MSNATLTDATGSVDHQTQNKLGELAELISVQQYGSDGPPKALTFREIEQAGYEAVQLAAAKFETGNKGTGIKGKREIKGNPKTYLRVLQFVRPA